MLTSIVGAFGLVAFVAMLAVTDLIHESWMIREGYGS